MNDEDNKNASQPHTADNHVDAPARLPGSGWGIIALVIIFGFLISILHPIGDAPDEQENLQYIQHVAKTWNKPQPENRLRQNMHPPLAFAMYALASIPLQAVTPVLPREIVWSHLLRVTIPLNQPSRYMMRDNDFVMRDGPDNFSAFTLLGFRLLSTLCMAVAAYFCIRAALLLLPDTPNLAAASVGFFFLVPGAILQTGAIGMEGPMLLFGSWTAFEMVRGFHAGLQYSPVRLGIAACLAGLVRHAGFALMIGAIPVAFARAHRIGWLRAFWELCIAGTIASCGFGSWVIHNIVTTGDPLVLYVNYAHFPEQFRTNPASLSSQDAWLPSIFGDFFGVRSAGLAPMRSLEFIFMWILGTGLVCGIFTSFRRDGGCSATFGRARLAFGAIVGLTVAMIPFIGNIHFYQTHGRYLLAMVPFVAPLFGSGLRHATRFHKDSLWYFAAPAIPALATGIMLLFSLGPMFAPTTGPSRGSVAYADCGGPSDPHRIRGFPVPITPENLFPRPENTFVYDPEQIEYKFPIAGDSSGLWLHITIPGITEANRAFTKVSYVYLAARISVGGHILADWVSPRIESFRWSYPIPATAVMDGNLSVVIERVPRLPFILVSEIRIDRTAPVGLAARGPKVRIAAADAREGVGEQIGAYYAHSYYVRHVAAGVPRDSIVCQTPTASFSPGKYQLRARIAMPRGVDGTDAGLLIVGDAAEPFVKVEPLVFRSATAGRIPVEHIMNFTIPDGPPLNLTCRIQSSGNVDLDVDDIEILGPLD